MSTTLFGWKSSNSDLDARITALENGSTIPSPLTTKGDLFSRNSSGNTRLPIGIDNQVLIADSTTTTGLRYVGVTGVTGINITSSGATGIRIGITTPTLINGTGYDGTTEEALMWNTSDNKLYRRTDIVSFDPTNNGSIYSKTISTTTNNILIGSTPIDSWLDQSVKTNASPSFNNVIVKNGATNKTTLTSAASSTTAQAIFPDGIGYVVLRDLSMTLTNKNLGDSTTFVIGTNDSSKKFQLIADVAGTGTTTQLIANSTANRTINLPNASTTLLGNNNTDVITNKTIAYGSNTITGLPVSSYGYAAYYVLNNTSISNVADTIVPYDTSIATDSGISNNGSGTFTINTAGVYTVVATIGYLLSGAGFRRSYIMFNSSPIQYGQNRIIGSGSIDGFMVSSFTAKLSVGDTIKVMTLQSSGGNLTLIGYNGFTGTSMTMVQMTRIS